MRTSSVSAVTRCRRCTCCCDRAALALRSGFGRLVCPAHRGRAGGSYCRATRAGRSRAGAGDRAGRNRRCRAHAAVRAAPGRWHRLELPHPGRALQPSPPGVWPAVAGTGRAAATAEQHRGDGQRLRTARGRTAAEGAGASAGWSVGGILAQAMAVRLHEIGRDVGELVLLDAYPSECWRAEPEPDAIAALRATTGDCRPRPGCASGTGQPGTHTRVPASRRGALGSLPDVVLDGVVRAVTGTNRLIREHIHGRSRHAGARPRWPGSPGAATAAVGVVAEPRAQVQALELPFLHAELTAAMRWRSWHRGCRRCCATGTSSRRPQHAIDRF